MSLDLDLEIKLTAYAVGELEPEEREQLEARLAKEPELAAFVEEMRSMSALLASELTSEPAPVLDAAARARIEAELASDRAPELAPALNDRRRPRWHFRAAVAGIATAAVVSIAALLVAPRSPEMVITEIRARVNSAGPEATNDDLLRGAPGNTGELARKKPRLQDVTISNPRTNGWHEPALAHDLPPAGESYARFDENPFLDVRDNALSTFSIDVDTASYANLRRMITSGVRPPRHAVRIEEMINYFQYRLPPPDDGRPFALHVDVTDAPWNSRHLLARVALKGKEINRAERADANLVFLIDVSGSMNEPKRLPLVKESLRLLIESLRPEDSVAIVVYAGASGLVLPPTSGARQKEIEAALARLNAGGSTNGGSGIQLAYQVAKRTFKPGGINRVLLATDGDFNVGIVDRRQLESLIVREAKSGIFLTVLGYGMGNYQDATLELLADKGNGNYAYIDRLEEARKVLVDELTGTLQTIAKDVKVQLLLNPLRVRSYRLIGYENRMMAARDFDDDKKDAGEIGAGHAVTALYELVPEDTAQGASGDLFKVRLRYKEPEGEKSQLIERSVHNSLGHYQNGSVDLRFAAAVAAFGMILRDSPHKGDATLEKVAAWARGALDVDHGGLRTELVDLVERARNLR